MTQRARDYSKPWRWFVWYPGWRISPKQGGGVRRVMWPGNGWILQIGVRAFESEGPCAPTWVPLFQIGTVGGLRVAFDKIWWRDDLHRAFKPIFWLR